MFIGDVDLTAEDGKDKMLLAARKIRRATCTDFVISLVADDFSRASSTYVGKLRLVLPSHSSLTSICLLSICVSKTYLTHAYQV